MRTTHTYPALDAAMKAPPTRLFSETYPPRVMPPLLGAADLTALFLLNVFWVTNVTPLAAGGTASFTYWIIGGMLFFIPCSLVLAQLAALFPMRVRSTTGPITRWDLDGRSSWASAPGCREF